MKKKTSSKTKSDFPAKARSSLKLLDLKPKKNPKAGAGPHVRSIQDGVSNTIMVKGLTVDPSDPSGNTRR